MIYIITQQILADVRLVTGEFVDYQFSILSNTFVQSGSSLDEYM